MRHGQLIASCAVGCIVAMLIDVQGLQKMFFETESRDANEAPLFDGRRLNHSHPNRSAPSCPRPPPTFTHADPLVEERERQTHQRTTAAAGDTDLVADGKWSCRQFPHRCAFVMHSFLMGKSRRAEVEKAAERTDTTFAFTDFWMAVHAATELRRVYPLSPILLATNYPTKVINTLLKLPGVTSGFTEIIVANASFNYVLKADAMRFVDPVRYPRALFIDSDTVAGNVSGAELLWSAAGYGPDTPTWFMPKGNGLKKEVIEAAVKRLEERGCSNATKTCASSSRQLLFSVMDALQHHSLSAVPESNAFRDLGPALYDSLLREDVAPYEQNRKKLMKYSHLTPFEAQYNTGLLGYRNDPCTVDGFMERWRHLHRSDPVCLKDITAWDQCSFPFALRESESRIAPFSSVFNFRQALGRGCSALVYGADMLFAASNWKSSLRGPVDGWHAAINHNQIKPQILDEIGATSPEVARAMRCRIEGKTAPCPLSHKK